MIKQTNFFKKYQLNKSGFNKVLNSVFCSGYFILGPELEKFERNFSLYLGVKHVIGLNSGTDAIFLALKAFGVKAGDEVITVANTATPTICAIIMAGGKPVFVDVNHDDFNINVGLIEKKITRKTKVILPVHLYGRPVNLSAILKIAKNHHLAVIEDTAQATGAKFNNHLVGTIGEAGCFSFYPTKNLGAFGDAGAVATNNSTLAKKIRALRNYGEMNKFKNQLIGVNSRLDEIQAAILNFSLTKLNIWNDQREKLAKLYLKELRGLPVDLPLDSDKIYKNCWHLFVIKTKKRDQLKHFLFNKGIQTSVHYPFPVFKQPAFKYLNYHDADLPITACNAKEILTLPLYPELTAVEVLRVTSAIKEFYGGK